MTLVKSRLDYIAQIWDECRATHAEIITEEDEEVDSYVANRTFSKLQNLYEDITELLTAILSELEIANEVTISAHSHADSVDSGVVSAKLPKIDLPDFSGDPNDWENFRDLFESLIHNHPRLTEATKLSYLKSCLKGFAAELVKDVHTTNANYASTWNALNARFHNPRLIANNHFQKFVDLPYLKKESATELRSFIDEAHRIIRVMKNMGLPVKNWDMWLVFTITARLDPESRKLWENELSEKDIRFSPEDPITDISKYFPTFDDLSRFLEKRARALGMIDAEKKATQRAVVSSKPAPGSKRSYHAAFSGQIKSKCPLCTADHSLKQCSRFKAKTPFERREEARRFKLCFNCLGNHKFIDCKSEGRCLTCKSKHHSMLHYNSNQSKLHSNQTSVASSSKPEGEGSNPRANVHTASISSSSQYTVILATAQFVVIGPNGNQTKVRALLDQGSETSFISSKIANLLDLPKSSTRISLSGLGAQDVGTARFSTQFMLQSLIDPSFNLKTEALILPQLTSQLPSRRVLELNLKSLSGMELADPQFHVPDSIDVILGADVYGQLLLSGLRRFPSSSIIAQQTVLGWIISGPVSSRRAEAHSRSSVTAFHCTVDNDLDESLQRFWNLEEVPHSKSLLNPDESSCEELFKTTHTRDSTGQFIVRLPLKSKPPSSGVEMRRMALSSLERVHQRFQRDAKYAECYRDFMLKYEQLGHMERVPPNEIHNPDAWYLPHHAVIQPSRSDWKMRVVFDASRKTHDKVCLNDYLLPGPALQSDLSMVLLNWRRFRFVFTADIVKMFRQIAVAPDQRDLQRIVWSTSLGSPPVDYRLTTVTYGTSCAPYLAIRTLLQLAQDEKLRFPLGAQCLENNTYVDDIFSGADFLEDAIKEKQELVDLLQSAGIELGKWAANHSDLVPSVPSNCESSKSIGFVDSVKTLGIQWSPTKDEFHFTTLEFAELTGASTKRAVLSTISRLFDPLGWLAPITVTAKILMQDLWIAKCGWDDPVPASIRDRWVEYCQSLFHLPSLSINRWFGSHSDLPAQIHGFCDASSRAMAAAVYLRFDTGNGEFRTVLLAAKTKVAPVKTVSIPNLELCGAALLTKLIRSLLTLKFLQNLPIFAWSDSQIVLQWLKKHPCHWKTFIANRVSFIQTELPRAVWAHVPTKENPADLGTRGARPIDLIDSNLWWYGPKWLSKSSDCWPQGTEAVRVLHVRTKSDEPDLIAKFSSLDRLVRVIARCFRPIVALRRRKNKLDPLPDFLTVSELNKARDLIIKRVQGKAFSSEIKLLKAGKPLPKRSPLLRLNPFVDEQDGLLRVGGRLVHSNLSYQNKHPPILPKSAELSRLFVRQAHRNCLHGGPTLTSSVLSQRVWIIGRNRLVKTEIRTCVRCQRACPRLAHQMMGNLPALRTTPARPFTTSGLDYAGPFQIRAMKGRGHKSYKGYIALFVCFSTRAIHLEVVEDLHSDTFISAFRRFAGRRGVCQNLFSDNATTFHGAEKELRSMFNAAATFYQTAAAELANDGTTWNFIPPNSPHYGGLWEAGVKSVKHHLKRAIGDRMFTFSELSTILVEIEACLNSRPLSPLSSDLEDIHALTPSHFLIGETSGLIPDAEPPEIPENRLSRLHLLQAVRNQFWKRWSKEYLQHLQERIKWRSPEENFSVGQLVIMRDDRCPPAKWPLVRVTEVHPGPDGLVRVLSVRTATSSFQRHIARLCPLLLEIDFPKKSA